MEVSSIPQIAVDSGINLEDSEDKEDPGLAADDHLMTLKALTEKLRLETRRPSYLEWKARLEAQSFRDSAVPEEQPQTEHEEASGKPHKPKDSVVNSDMIQCKSPPGMLKGFGNIDEALCWLRKELVSSVSHTKTYLWRQ